MQKAEETKTYNSERVFAQLMQRVGDNGTYQRRLLLLWCSMTMIISSAFFSNPFLMQSPDFVCPDQSGNECDDFVCNIPESLRTQYYAKDVNSMATSFGDYHCEKQSEITAFQSFIYLGGLIGVFLGSTLSQCFMKKQLMILTLITSILFYLLVLFAPSLFIGVIGLFVNYAMRGVQMQLIFCFFSQTLSEQESNKHISIVLIFYGIGVTMNGPIFWILQSWKKVIALYYILPNLILLGIIGFYVEETPMDSVVHCEPEQSFHALQKVASINETTNTHGITIQEIAHLRSQYQQSQKQKHDYQVSMLDLLTYPSLRVNAILINVIYLLSQFSFDGPELVLNDNYFSIYENGFIIGSSEIISCCVCYFIIDKYPRRWLVIIPSTVGLLVALSISVVSNCSEECSRFQNIFETVGLFVFRMMMSLVFNVVLIIELEMFPTQVRTLGALMVAASGFIGTMLIPEVSDLLKRHNLPIEVSFCVSSMAVIILTVILPETHNNPPPDMIQELKFIHAKNIAEPQDKIDYHS